MLQAWPLHILHSHTMRVARGPALEYFLLYSCERSLDFGRHVVSTLFASRPVGKSGIQRVSLN